MNGTNTNILFICRTYCRGASFFFIIFIALYPEVCSAAGVFYRKKAVLLNLQVSLYKIICARASLSPYATHPAFAPLINGFFFERHATRKIRKEDEDEDEDEDEEE